jgi:hypothetical protein
MTGAHPRPSHARHETISQLQGGLPEGGLTPPTSNITLWSGTLDLSVEIT